MASAPLSVVSSILLPHCIRTSGTSRDGTHSLIYEGILEGTTTLAWWPILLVKRQIHDEAYPISLSLQYFDSTDMGSFPPILLLGRLEQGNSLCFAT